MDIYELELVEIDRCCPAKAQLDFAKSCSEFYLNKPAGWIRSKHFDFELLSSMNPSEDFFTKAALKGFNMFIFSRSTVNETLSFFRSKSFSEPRKLLSFDEVPIGEQTQYSIVDFARKIGWSGVIVFCAHDGYPLYVVNRE